MEKNKQFPADLEALLEEVIASLGEETITDRNQAYAVNVVYDRIRDALMENQALWQSWQHTYWQKKYISYDRILTRLEDSLKREFADRMAREFHRAMAQDQLDPSAFEPDQWQKIQRMVAEANGDYGTRGAIKKIVYNMPAGSRKAVLAVVALVTKAKKRLEGGKR